MTVPSGRAGSGARSVLRAVFCGVFAIVGLVAGGCGSGTFFYGTVIVTVSAAPGTVTYSVKFDPAHPLVVSRATPTTFDLHFDMSAATVVDPTVSPVKVTVRPYLTAS